MTTAWEIARKTARSKALEYAIQERQQEQPLAFEYVVSVISADISTALYNGGYSRYEYSPDRRERVAINALREAGYPREQNGYTWDLEAMAKLQKVVNFVRIRGKRTIPASLSQHLEMTPISSVEMEIKKHQQNPQLLALYSQPFFHCSVCDQEKVIRELYDPNMSVGKYILCNSCAAVGKHCSRCGTYQAFENFWKASTQGSRGGVGSYCKPCRKADSRERYKVNGKSVLQIERERIGRLKQYNLTLEQYQEMYTAQGGVCASCGLPERRVGKKSGEPVSLHIDHDHTTGEVRELLCGGCNVALGNLLEDPERIRKLLAYAEKWQRIDEAEEASITI